MVQQEDESPKPTPENTPKPLAKWTDQEIDEFREAFSRDDFELIRPKDSEEEGYVKVKVPVAVEPMTRGLIAAEWKMVEAFDSPLEKISQETVSQRLAQAGSEDGVSEEEEAQWIQTFGRFFEVVGHVKGVADPALEELRRGIRSEAHRIVTQSLRILLDLANVTSWVSYIKQQSELYPGNEVPQEVIAKLTAKLNDYQEMRSLLNRDPQADEAPKFLLVSSTGRQIFKSTPEIGISG